jgi:localization factor PodJL
MQSAPVDDRALERLQKDIRALSQKLDLSAASKPIQPPSDIRGLEQSISDLLQRVDGLKADLGVTAEQAVRRAASDVLARAPDREGLAPAGDTVQMQRQLSEIHVAQQEAERRTSETLGAVHETLKWVVDRLVDMEREMKQQADIGLQQPKPVAAQLLPDEPAAGGTARQPLPMAAEAAVVSTRPIVTNPLPPLGAPLQQPSSQAAVQMPGAVVAPAAAQEAMSPDASAIGRIAAMRAQRIGVSVPTPQAAPASKSAIASAFAAAREAVAKRKSDKDKAGQPAAETGDESLFKPEEARQTSTARNPNGTTASATTLDVLLEPGSGRPRLHARVEAADVNSKDPKAEFIAAARRAAHTAIDQSAEALQQPAADSKPAKPGKARKAGLQKKHALLLGLAALIVAVGATLQLMREPQKPAGGTGQTPQNPSSLLLPMDRTQLAEAPARPAQTTPRQILPSSTEPLPPSLTQAKPDDRVMSQPPRAAQTGTVLQQPEPTIVGSILPDTSRIQGGPSGTPRAVPPVSNDPLMQFNGISGSERLKAAARAGDPAAFIELGSRYLEGRGAPRDLKAAALWFERASDLGAAPAQYRLGAMYREGRGVERNARLAMKYFLTAADAGNARAMHNTAVLLAEGVNGSPDYAGAGEWFKKASEFGIRDSQYNLAILHARGLGVGQDLMASYMWFAAAAASGDEDAAKKRDEVGARLSPEKLQQAKAAAQAWKPKTPDPASNEVAVPPGGWDAGAKQVPAAAQAGAKPKPNRT